jgi:prepilin-type N-terminal cleavage/methylation domain-containing protein
MRKRGGFTLIELMIVIAIIAIIAAIAIPSLLRSQKSANERSASASLRKIVDFEALWRSQDPDGNTVNDYWTGDVCTLYSALRGTLRKGTMDDMPLARADTAALGDNMPISDAGVTSGNQPDNTGQIPKSGYFYQVMTLMEDGVTSYQVDTSGQGYSYYNLNDFAFCSYPENYGTSGDNTFIVNVQGTVWSMDNGGVVVTQWPAADPSTVGWRAVE